MTNNIIDDDFTQIDPLAVDWPRTRKRMRFVAVARWSREHRLVDGTVARIVRGDFPFDSESPKSYRVLRTVIGLLDRDGFIVWKDVDKEAA